MINKISFSGKTDIGTRVANKAFDYVSAAKIYSPKEAEEAAKAAKEMIPLLRLGEDAEKVAQKATTAKAATKEAATPYYTSPFASIENRAAQESNIDNGMAYALAHGTHPSEVGKNLDKSI